MSFNASEYVIKNLQEYGTYFNEERAIPSIYSGLKPVQTKILFAAKGLGLKSTGKYKKVVNLVGATMPLYQHGDSSLEGAIARMGQNWKCTYPLLNIQGNIGSQSSLDAPNSGAASSRYIETRLSPLGELLLNSIKEGTAKMVPNFDNTLTEPEHLFAPVPVFLLLNQKGIGVGTATSIPSFRLESVLKVTAALMDNPNLSFNEIANILEPFYVQKAKVVNKSELAEIYSKLPREGKKGSIKFRAEFKVQDNKIIISNFPYDASPSKVISQIDKKIGEVDSFKLIRKAQDITSLNDKKQEVVSMELVVANGADSDQLIKDLCHHTSLQSYASLNLVMLDKYNKVKEYNIKTALLEWIDIFKEKTIDKLNTEKNTLSNKEEILRGLLKAIKDDIDEIIELIKTSDSRSAAKIKIENKGYSSIQADAILDMKLVKLANLEYEKLLNEREEILIRLSELNEILLNENKIFGLMKTTMQEHSNLEIFSSIDIIDAEFPKVKKLKSEKIYINSTKGGISISESIPKKIEYVATKSDPLYVLSENLIYPISNAKLEFISEPFAIFKNEEGYVVHVSKDGYVKITAIKDMVSSRKSKATDQDKVFSAFVVKTLKPKLQLQTTKGTVEVELSKLKISGKTTKGNRVTKEEIMRVEIK